MTKRADAVDKLGEALQEVRGVWTENVRSNYDNVAKQFRSLKTRNKNLEVYKSVVFDLYRPVLIAVYDKLGIELPIEFDATKETVKLMTKLEQLKMGQRLGS